MLCRIDYFNLPDGFDPDAIPFWAWEGQDDTISPGTLDAAIDEELDEWEPEWLTGTLTMAGMAPMKIPVPAVEHEAECVLDDVLDRFDEEYGHEDCEMQEPTEAMKDAARAFVRVVRDGFTVRQLETIVLVDVDVKRWLDACVSSQMQGDSG